MATKKISELEAITEADDSDVLAIVDVSEGKTNKITKNNLLIGAGHSIEMSLNQEIYALTLTLKNAAGTELSTASIDLPNENAVTNISYNNGKLTLTKQSGATSTVDISGLINGLVTESDFSTFTTALQETIGAINVKNEQQDEAIENNYKVITKLQEDVEDLTERMEDAENNEMTYTPTPATSHYLQDSADSRFRKFIPIGRTTQESTTGKQLFNKEAEIVFSNIELNDWNVTPLNTGIRVKTTYTYNGGAPNVLYVLKDMDGYQNKLVRIKSNIYISGQRTGRIVMGLSKEDGTDRNQLTFLEVSGNIVSVQIPSELGESHYLYVSFYSIPNKNATVNDYIDYTDLIVTIDNEDMTYEPYTGGEPAPNPKYPIDIKNTGDNGSVNVKVENKNFLDSNAPTTTRGGVTLYNNGDGSYTLNGTFTSNAAFQLTTKPITLEIGKTYTQSIEVVSGTFRGRVVPSFKNSNGEVQYNYFMDNSTKTTTDTMTLNSYDYYISNGTTVDCTFKVQLEEGPSATGFQVHSEQNISFPLAEGQKFYEGSYPDDDEKVHHKMLEQILDGTENWEETSTAITGKYRWLLIVNNIKATSSTSEIPEIFSTHYKAVAFAGGNGTYNNVQGISVANYGSKIGIYDNTYNTDLNAWKAYLAEQYANGTPVKVIYPLAEEQTEDFTEEQKTAWKEWKKARTYKGGTHISSEDETPANVEITYVRDLETVINNLTTRVETIESEV